MYSAVLACLVSSLLLQLGAAEQPRGYHQAIGIPLARKYQIRQAVNSRIIGGVASKKGEFPYVVGLLVSLQSEEVSACGGTLLNAQRVLTAASCWYDGYSRGTNIKVLVGATDLEDDNKIVESNTVYSHPNFDPYTPSDDIALIVTPHIKFTRNVRPVVMPTELQLKQSYTGSRATVIGYGDFAEGRSDGNLASAKVRVLSNVECQQFYGGSVTSNVLCSSGEERKGPCNGDLGGPLVLKNYDGNNDLLIGVVLFPPLSGCSSKLPAAYSRVTAYNNWIRSLLV